MAARLTTRRPETYRVDSAHARILRVQHALIVAIAALRCREDDVDPDDLMTAVAATLTPAAGDVFWLLKQAPKLATLVAPDDDDVADAQVRGERLTVHRVAS